MIHLPVPPVASKKSASDRSTSGNSVSSLRSGKSAPASSGPSNLWENIKAVLVTVAFFLVMRTFLIEAYRIPSGSMIPTLLVGDWLFVNK
ncbi:S26 family signal peptidase, partial [Gemmatimonas sp.]